MLGTPSPNALSGPQHALVRRAHGAAVVHWRIEHCHPETWAPQYRNGYSREDTERRVSCVSRGDTKAAPDDTGPWSEDSSDPLGMVFIRVWYPTLVHTFARCTPVAGAVLLHL